MQRAPVHQRRITNRQIGRDAVWSAIRQLSRQQGEFTLRDIESQTRELPTTINDYVRGLTLAGYLERTDTRQRGRYTKGRWRLIRDIGVERPYVDRNGKEVTQGRGQEQLWRTMKILKTFDKHELAIHASTEEHPVTVNTAGTYIRHLKAAGYLAVVRAGGPNRPERYRLLPSRNTGPRPPQIQKCRQVWDANLCRVVWTQPGEEIARKQP